MIDKEFFLLKGLNTEDRFASQLENAIRSSSDEDMYDHIDIKQHISFDVKGIKKVRRSDETHDENYHWVEIKNVRGDNGWLYGKADFFVFETLDYWIVVDKDKLQDFIADKCKLKQWSSSPTAYKLYRRATRELEVLTLVKTLDLCYLATKIINKL